MLNGEYISTDLSSWARLEGVEDRMGEWMSEFDRSRSLRGRLEADLASIREKLPEGYQPWHPWVFLLDKKVCGTAQVPASELLGLGSDSEAVQLAIRRSLRGISQLAELGGDAVGVFGVNAGEGVMAAIGLGVALTARLADGVIDNANGSAAQNILREVTAPLISDKRLKLAVKKLMDEKGVGDTLIDNANLLYGMELNPINLKMADSVARPVLTASAMISAGNLWGILIGTIGSLARPLGQYILHYEKSEKVPAQKLASNTGEKMLLAFMRKKHLQMVTGIRVLAEAPAFFKLATVIFKDQLGPLFAGTFMGAIDGAQGLSGTVTRSRDAVAASEQVEAVITTLDYLKSADSPILSEVSYPLHVAREAVRVNDLPPRFKNMNNGIAVHKLTPVFGNYPEGGISNVFQSGDVVRIMGASGKGKTVFLESLRHSYNHKGLIAFVRNGETIDAHSLTRSEIRQRIVSLSRDSLAARGGRVIDFASELFEMVVKGQESYPDDKVLDEVRTLIRGMSSHDLEVLFNAGYDIAKLNEDNKLLSQYSHQLRRSIKPFLNLKKKWVDQLIERYIPAKENVTSNSMFENELSQGQKQRVINALLRGYFAYGDVDVLILDEIMEGLDPENAEKTVDDLYGLVEESRHKPVIMWLAHTRNELPARKFGKRYKEFDLNTSLYEDERKTLIREAILDGVEYFEVDELRQLGQAIAEAEIFLEKLNFDNLPVHEILTQSIYKSLEVNHIEWIEFVNLVNLKLGFKVTEVDIIDAISRVWPEPSKDIDNLVQKYAMYDRAIWTILNVPIIKWFDVDSLGVAGQMGPGDSMRIMGRIAETIDNYFYHVAGREVKGDWQRWLIRKSTIEAIKQIIGDESRGLRKFVYLLDSVEKRTNYHGSGSKWAQNLANFAIPNRSLELGASNSISILSRVREFCILRADENNVPELTLAEKAKLDSLIEAADGIFRAYHHEMVERYLIQDRR